MPRKELTEKRGKRDAKLDAAKAKKRTHLSSIDEDTAGTSLQEKITLSGDEQPILAVIERAVEVIGDRQEAMRWLGTPVPALNYATPISRLNDAYGQADVLRVLTQLEHGVL